MLYYSSAVSCDPLFCQSVLSVPYHFTSIVGCINWNNHWMLLVHYSTSMLVTLVAMVIHITTIIILQLLLTPFFPEIVCNPIGEFFMLRDSTLIPNILWFEYTSLKSEAK